MDEEICDEDSDKHGNNGNDETLGIHASRMPEPALGCKAAKPRVTIIGLTLPEARLNFTGNKN
jgi:hypothetical protein